MKKILIVAGARPNFMKIAPILEQMKKFPDRFLPMFIHTGQHYDDTMSKFFIDDLGLPEADFYLGVGSASHAVQTAKIMIEFEKVLIKEKPDLVIVVGDVNSTLACALDAAKLLVPVAHVEAGLRSRDWTMPEEVNRVLTDQVSDYLFTTSEGANKNLLNEGVSGDRIHFVGNTMIESLLKFKHKFDQSTIHHDLGLTPNNYALLTLHRPSNVDQKSTFDAIFNALHRIQEKITIVFPAHPRTQKQIKAFGLYPILHQKRR